MQGKTCRNIPSRLSTIVFDERMAYESATTYDVQDVLYYIIGARTALSPARITLFFIILCIQV